LGWGRGLDPARATQTAHASGTPPTTDCEWSLGVVQALTALEAVPKALLDADAVRSEALERAQERVHATTAAAAPGAAAATRECVALAPR
jgi:hypothetical protein